MTADALVIQRRLPSIRYDKDIRLLAECVAHVAAEQHGLVIQHRRVVWVKAQIRVDASFVVFHVAAGVLSAAGQRR